MKKVALIILTAIIPIIIAIPAHAEDQSPVTVESNIATPPAKLVANPLRTRIKGTLTLISPQKVTVKTDGTTYTIALGPQTKLLRRFGGRSSLSEFSLGDEIMAVGTLNDDNKTSLTARLIRDLALQKRHGLFVGEISSLTPTGFVLKIRERSMQTVIITTNTQLFDRENQTITQSQLQPGQKIKIWGLWDKKQSTIQASKIRDLSLPPATNTTATPSGNPASHL